MTEGEIVDSCACLGVKLSMWQREWLRNWITAGRPQALPAQYECATAVAGARLPDVGLQGPALR